MEQNRRHWAGAVPDKCPECGSRQLDHELLPEDSWYDQELADECGVERGRFDDRFSYINVLAWCDECITGTPYGWAWYYNPDTNAYDLTLPKALQREPPINDPALYDKPLL